MKDRQKYSSFHCLIFNLKSKNLWDNKRQQRRTNILYLTISFISRKSNEKSKANNDLIWLTSIAFVSKTWQLWFLFAIVQRLLETYQWTSSFIVMNTGTIVYFETIPHTHTAALHNIVQQISPQQWHYVLLFNSCLLKTHLFSFFIKPYILNIHYEPTHLRSRSLWALQARLSYCFLKNTEKHQPEVVQTT